MEKLGFWDAVWDYLRGHAKLLFLLFSFILIFGIVFSLYRLETEAVFYAAVLCLCVGTVFALFDFSRYYKQRLQLLELRHRVIFLLSQLPEPHNAVDQDYHDLIAVMMKESARQSYRADSAITDMVDYYTLWAHQIKTPIAAMRLLLKEEESEQNSQLLAELFKIEQYVQMVLSYLRLNSTSTDFVFRRHPLEKLVKQAVRKYAPLFIHKKIRLNLQPMDCQVLTDEKWLVFVIEQLLSNALKYTMTGSISIYLRAENILVIEDTGIGIAPEDLPRIFEQGFTGYNGRNDKKATGLGLYLCKQICKKLSHTISIESTPGQGTKVILDLNTLDLRGE